MDSSASTPPSGILGHPPGYTFPSHRLVRTMRDGRRTPIALVACGSFSPITYLHLRMFEMAKDYYKHSEEFEVVAAYMSPVNDDYKKQGLLSAYHRTTMCTLATEQTSNWIMTDAWEGSQLKYQPTATVLDHFDHELNRVIGGVSTAKGERKRVRVLLLAGSDLIMTMSEPGVWSPRDLERILGRYGAVIIERSGSDLEQAISALSQWRENIFLVRQTIQNDVSSTKVRLFLKRGMSVRYLLPSPVVDYIELNHLYVDDNTIQPPSTTASQWPSGIQTPLPEEASPEPSNLLQRVGQLLAVPRVN